MARKQAAKNRSGGTHTMPGGHRMSDRQMTTMMRGETAPKKMPTGMQPKAKPAKKGK